MEKKKQLKQLRKGRLTLPEVQALAQKHVVEALSTTAIPVGVLQPDEEQFAAIMNTVTRMLLNAWAAGYYEGH